MFLIFALADLGLVLQAQDADRASKIYAEASKSVLLLLVRSEKGEVVGQGTGFVVAGGKILTNEHVVRNGRVLIDLGAARLSATVERVDAFNDLALLSAGAELEAKPLMIADGSPTPGTSVFAIGNPAGLERSISTGVVSGVRDLRGRQLLQITAPISSGSSGGPILNTRGEVVGVAVGILETGQNLNFAVPAALIRKLLVGKMQASADVVSLSAAAAPGDKVIIRVGEATISQSEFERYIDMLPDQYKTMARGQAKRQFADQLVSMKTLSQEARKRKLDQTPEFQRQVEIQKDNILAGLVFQDLAEKLKIEEAAVRQYYDQHKGEYERVRARHILIRAKGSPMPVPDGKQEIGEEEALAKAKALSKRIGAGEDFAALAKSESDDTGSGAQGGDLGFFQKGRMVPAFEQAAFALPVKQLSEPVKTPFGYHLILVEQHENKTFDELRPELEKKMRPDLAKKAIEDLKKSVTVQLDETYFGPARE
ncbi:MAG: peptidylprolyl isomerase [Acidobacteria bacterium]|nr:peptidylprolyl isomerase [Acidobacteriota bacterium]